MDEVFRARVRAQMREPVPVPKTPAFHAWEDDVRALGVDCIDTLLEVLETGEVNEQYAALLSLRLYGYEAWADGYWHDIVYPRARRDGGPRDQAANHHGAAVAEQPRGNHLRALRSPSPLMRSTTRRCATAEAQRDLDLCAIDSSAVPT